jgi:hypothetical protein
MGGNRFVTFIRQGGLIVHDEQLEPVQKSLVSRRSALKGGAAVAGGLAALESVGKLAFKPARAGAAEAVLASDPQAITANLPDIQHDIGRFLGGGAHAVQTINGVQVQFGPVFTAFVTATLARTPSRNDQTVLTNALATIENTFAFGPSGIFTFVAYGLPYFRRLPASLVNSAIPKLTKDTTRSVLEEAQPSPTDVRSGANITKMRFNVPVRIESNDMLFTFRSDSQANITSVINWLQGSNNLNGRGVASPAFNGLIRFTSVRTMFQQNGLPKQVANNNGLPFRNFINPQSPMWMGFADQQTNSSGPAAITTFLGNASDRGRTTARSGDYMDNGSIQHLSHNILDMMQFFDIPDGSTTPGDDGVFTERVQYMFTSPQISNGNTDQLTNGGGPAFLPNNFKGVNEASRTAQGIGTNPDANNPGQNEHRIGHEAALQRSSRAADGTPIHIRMDGAGFDGLDVPGGANTAKLQFTVFVPTADFFNLMRRNGAAVDLQTQFDVDEDENGLERFMTATRRQNFLSPPRRHRAYPLIEFT